ncbi:hypothetical protein [Rubellimicrobium roseum]|uniref:Uncharacterized protein n=1 Tax=Rubellimicrobium roseum TaxID=687525 RepID=A0A5C4NID5_9RHOB|nr:hypothetical protein [Rubellimicrobium roseum]TNC73690.1 hypothetical protein FHG71_04180 [Rubellimicrobium roseum]
MKHDKVSDERRRGETRERIIRAAEQVLARAYRFASRQEMIESQFRVRESVVREMRRRLR